MESLSKALSSLRTWYKEHGNGMPYSAIVDATGLSESTVQRYLNPKSVINPSYNNILAIASAIGMEASELSFSREMVEHMDKQQLAELVLEIRKFGAEELRASREADDARWRERLISEKQAHVEDLRHLNQSHIEDMQRMKDEHAAEMARSHEAHNEHVLQIHKMYDRQMESIRAANAAQISAMLEGHARQLESVQSLDQAQRNAVQEMAVAQKDADEKSKDFLKAEISQRDSRIAALDHRDNVKNMIIFSLIIIIFLLFFIDFMLPNAGWIRNFSTRMFSYYPYG